MIQKLILAITSVSELKLRENMKELRIRQALATRVVVKNLKKIETKIRCSEIRSNFKKELNYA